MSKTVSKFALAASIVLATTFTLSCSSGDDGSDNPSSSSGGGGSSSSNPGGDSSSSGGEVNPSELSNKKVSLVEWDCDDDCVIEKKGEFSESGTFTVYLKLLEKDEGTYIPIGKIVNGTLSLDSLPSIPSEYSEYFNDFSGECQKEWAADYLSSCEGNLSFPANLSVFWDAYLNSDIPNCDIGLYMVKSGKWSEGPGLAYFSKSGKITGTEAYTYIDEEKEGPPRSHTWNASISAGWNFYYEIGELRDDTRYYTHTTTPPSGATVEWGLECW